jgi:hypothetical protein
LHVIALAAAIASLAVIPMLLVCLGVLLSAAAVAKGFLHAGGIGIMALSVRENGDVTWKDRAGEWHSAGSLSASFVSPWLTIVRLDPQDRGARACWLLLGPDSSEPEDLRQLRVWLTHRPPAEMKSPDAN